MRISRKEGGREDGRGKAGGARSAGRGLFSLLHWVGCGVFREREKEKSERDEKSFSFFDCLFCFLSPFFLSAMADLADFISFSSVEALNENPEHTFQNALKKVRKTTREGKR